MKRLLKPWASYTTLQKLGFFYASLFFGVVIIGYIPLLSPDGLLLGMFKIDLQDDLLHGFSGTWALLASLHSEKEARRYFQWFGLYYTADAFVGFFTGYTIIDVMIQNSEANHGHSSIDFVTNLLVNLPHFILGPSQLLIGHLVGSKDSCE